MVFLSMCGSSASGAYGSGGSVNGIVISPLSSIAICVFESIRESQHRGLVEMLRHNLHPDRQAVAGVTARYAHARDSRQAAGDGIDIREVHSQRIVYLLAQFKRR